MNSRLIGLFIIFVIATLYYYFFYDVINVNKLETFNGTLKELPFYGSYGGDFQHKYVRLRLRENSEDFVFQSCSYTSLEFSKLNKLIVGDSVSVKVERDALRKNEYDVFNFLSSKYGVILDVQNVNACGSKDWKKMSFFAIIFLAFLFYKIIIVPVWRKIRKN